MKKPKTPSEVLAAAFCSYKEIAAAKKQAVSKYDSDLRYLNDLLMQVSTPEAQTQPELFDVGVLLSPKTLELLESPLKNYR